MAYEREAPTTVGFLNESSRNHGKENTLSVGGRMPFGEVEVTQRQNIFSIQPVWGLSYLNDVQVTSGTGTIVATLGTIVLQTGGTSGGYAELDTTQYGRYAPGKAAQFGIGLRQIARPTGGIIRAGMRLGQSEVAYEVNDGGWCFYVKRNGTLITSVPYGSFNQSNPADLVGFCSSQGIILGCTFTWYGYGKLSPTIWYAANSSDEFMTERILHHHQYDQGTSLVDPNMPIFIETSGASGTIAEVGGRRYDIIGEYDPPVRITGKTRSGLFTGANSAWNAPIAFRRKATFPTSGRENSVTVYLADYFAAADKDIEINFFSKGEVGGTWEPPTWVRSVETAVEMNVGITSLNINSTYHRAGPFLIHAAGSNKSDFGNSGQKGIRVPLVGGDSLIMAVRATAANTAEYDVAMRLYEEW